MILPSLFILLISFTAFRLKLLSKAGSALGAIFALTILLNQNFNWFLLIFSFFFLGAIFTKIPFGEKSSSTLSESKRGWRNVAANGVTAVFCASLGNLPAFIGSIAAVTADTLSCEIGELSLSKPRLITTFKKVKTGTNGGITLLGELGGLLGAISIGILAFLFILPDPKLILLSAIVGFLGTTFDSLLGAIFENKGILDKHGVNLLTGLFGALSAHFLFPLL